MKRFITRMLYAFPGSYGVFSKVSQACGGLFNIDLSHEQKLISHYFPDLRVAAGPFAGLTYEQYRSGIIMPAKLAGGYEKYLIQRIHDAISHHYDTLINVGSAEGYYAVGFAQAQPKMKVYAFDTSEHCQLMCRELAEKNKTDNVEVSGTFHMRDLRNYKHGKTLLFVDIEGFEKSLLDPALSADLAHCDIIVECHDFLNGGIVDTLLERFFLTHTIDIIQFQDLTSPLYDAERKLYHKDFHAVMTEPRAVSNQKRLRMRAH